LFPDKKIYVRAAQRGFEILDAHWDLPLRTVEIWRRSSSRLKVVGHWSFVLWSTTND
jgi:hypothetical protein